MSKLQEVAANAGGKFKHSMCQWCFGNIPLKELCVKVKHLGIESIEILGRDAWATVAKHGLECAMGMPSSRKGVGGISNAFQKKENHDLLVEIYKETISLAAKAKTFPKSLHFPGTGMA